MRHFPRAGLLAGLVAADPWEPARRPVRHADEALTGTTRQWLRRLPASRRPLQLCMSYPRVANRLAWHWRDPAEAQEVLDDLLSDRRGGRAGFPRPVAMELRRLREHLDRAAGAPTAPGCLDLLRRWWHKA